MVCGVLLRVNTSTSNLPNCQVAPDDEMAAVVLPDFFEDGVDQILTDGKLGIIDHGFSHHQLQIVPKIVWDCHYELFNELCFGVANLECFDNLTDRSGLAA